MKFIRDDDGLPGLPQLPGGKLGQKSLYLHWRRPVLQGGVMRFTMAETGFTRRDVFFTSAAARFTMLTGGSYKSGGGFYLGGGEFDTGGNGFYKGGDEFYIGGCPIYIGGGEGKLLGKMGLYCLNLDWEGLSLSLS